jgi:chaperonin cofactor prefoldin
MGRGVLTTRAAIRETKTYTIRNVDAKAKTLIIEHPARQGYKFMGNLKPVETTATRHRFQVALAPNANEKFAVQEERLLEQVYSVSSLTPDFLVAMVQTRALGGDARKQLESVLAKKREIAQVAGDMQRADAERAEVEKDQERVRQNLGALNRVAGQQDQVNRYAKQLSDMEGQLASLRDRASDLRKRKATLDGELAAMIERMEF